MRRVKKKATRQEFACKIMKLPKQHDEYLEDGMSR